MHNMMQHDPLTLDITQDICPMTFVKTRRLVDSMQEGQEATLIISGGEPLENLPRSLEELGHEVCSIAQQNAQYYLTFRKR